MIQTLSFLIQLLRSERIALNTYIYKQAQKDNRLKGLKRSVLRYKLRKAIKLLVKHKAAKVTKISSKLFEVELTDTAKALDLIASAAARNRTQQALKPQQSNENAAFEDDVTTAILPSRRLKSSELWRDLNPLRLKSSLSRNDKESIKENFELWLWEMKDALLIFKTHTEEFKLIPPASRFLRPEIAVKQLKKIQNAFLVAEASKWEGVFLTLTLPPIFPLQVQRWILSFLLHRIKALIRKHKKETVPHVRVNEPHQDFRLHLHVVIFKTDWIMNKFKLTNYLNKHLESFLRNLGEHYKRTVNNKATYEMVTALNLYGKKLLRKYRRYKRSKKGFVGPVNHISKIKRTDEGYIFENAPQDASKVKKTMHDGGFVGVFDYIKYYIMKNIYEVSEISNSDEKTPVKVKSIELAFYWYARLPFYYLSPIFHPKRERPPPSGWEFLGLVKSEEVPDLLQRLVQ